MKYKRNTNVKRTKEEVLKWYNEYLSSNLTTKDLNIKYNTDVYYQFKKYSLIITKKIKRRPTRFKKINYFFDKITNENEAYIMGFFLADGSVNKDKNLIKFHQKDILILQKIRDYCMPDASITKDKNSWVLNICSKQIGNNLKEIFNIDNTKSYLDFKLPFMENDLYRHFIRGYFDADGTVYYDRKYLKWNICSITNTILLEIQNILTESNINSNLNCEIREGKKILLPQGNFIYNSKNMYRLRVGKNKNLYKLFDFLYKDATIFLERKHSIFKQYTNIELTK